MSDICGMKRVHTNIDLLMHENGIKTDGEFAKLLGMTKQNFSQRLRGDITMSTLEIIANYFKVTVKDLLR